MLHTASHCLEVGFVPNSSIHAAYTDTATHCLEVGPVPNSSIHAAYSLSLLGGWVGPNSSIHGASKAL